ncbi:RNA polymerase sigma factor [Thioclava sp. GXIMD4216]|uniref:RNA polymerase sigma factor n=1 Tax=Thioclava litoralis TaxID=3076557 RepID=A0ABZ1E1N7_9RHOB|nr:RNA polymerase sigma factor [Thioclava sp. FTW29]
MAVEMGAETSDEALLLAYGQGDRAAAQALTVRLAPLSYRLACRMLRDEAEAEDVAQEAMLRLWKIAPQWRVGEAKVSTWLYRVTSNLATDRLRKRRATSLDEAGDPADETLSVDEQMLENQRAEALQWALDQLPIRQKQAVILRHLEGLSNPEIAEAMETGVEAVESLTARGKRALAALLRQRKDSLGYDRD